MPGVVIQIDGWDPVAGGPVTLRASSRDDPALCHLNGATWWPAIAKLPTLRYDLFDGAFGGQISAPSSSLTLVAEPWPDFGRYALADARFRLWTGEIGAAWAGYALRFDGRVSEQPALKDGQAEVAFAVDDRWLDAALLPTYAGSSGIEGPAALKGQAKPLALGAPRYVGGTLIDSVSSVFQVSSGPVAAIEAALERLVRFGAPIADHATYAALVAANVPRGTWATCQALGLARFGAPPTGQVSFLVRGDNGGPDGWARLPGRIIRRLALLSGGAGRIDEASLTALDAARPYPLSLYVDAQTTARQLIQQVAASVNAVAGVSWTGQLFVVPVGLSASTITLAADGSALPPVGAVEQVGIAAPWKKLAIGAERAWAVHALSDIAFTAQLVDLGAYDAATTYREGNIVQYQGSTWLYQNPTPTKGNAPPALPTAQDGFWRVLARAGAEGERGADGKDGINGLDGRDGANGAPGTPGADGRTSYVHYAYANSPDGRVDFDLNQPNGRAYEGSYTDFTAADSADPAAYAWREYKGPPFGMAARGAAVVAANSVVKNGGAAQWDSDAYSTSGYRGGAVATFSFEPGCFAMAGLNADPTADSSYASIDFAWYCAGDEAIIYENGAYILTAFTGIGREFAFRVEYDGRHVHYYVNEYGPYRSVEIGADKLFYFDSSISSPGGRIGSIAFVGRGANGLDGRDGLDGTNGLNGTNGQSIHIAFANSADGQLDFTTGDAGGRAYIGVYTDSDAGADSLDPARYGWTLIRGADGARGLPGPGGYAHIAYANSADGTVGFHLSDPTNRRYIGTYTDQIEADSGNPAAYAWQLVKGADGANGSPGTDGFIADSDVPVFVVECYSNGTPRPSWSGGSGTIRLTKGSAVITAGVTYSIGAQSGIASLVLDGSAFSFAGPVEDTGYFVVNAIYAGVPYARVIAVKKVRDGSAAFRSDASFSGQGGTATGSGNTTVPQGRTVTISGGASYLTVTPGPGRTIAVRGILGLYWRNVTDNGPLNFLGEVTGSEARSVNSSSNPNEPEVTVSRGSVAASFSFTSPSPDKQIAYVAQFRSNGSGGGNVYGGVSLEIAG